MKGLVLFVKAAVTVRESDKCHFLTLGCQRGSRRRLHAIKTPLTQANKEHTQQYDRLRLLDGNVTGFTLPLSTVLQLFYQLIN